MFYQCPKCKRIWQYPIAKCPDCFSILERIKSEKIKVIGASKVQIPTMFHPKTPYFVLLLEDENGNKWVQKSIKEYKIDELFKVEPYTDKGVAIWRIKYDLFEAIERVIELIGGLEIDSKTKILILPTLIAPKHPYFAENTSPEFLEATIQCLIEIGARPENMKVVAQSFNEIPIEASAQKSQLLNICQNFKILPLNLAQTNFVKKEIDNFSFEISEEALGVDLIINLPILKIGKISATENILKILKKENYLGLKYLYSDEEIIKRLIRVLRPFLTLAEGNLVQKSDGFVAHLNLVLASFDPLNLDRVFFEITLQKNLPEILKEVKIENIPISGRKIEEVQFDAKKYG